MDTKFLDRLLKRATLTAGAAALALCLMPAQQAAAQMPDRDNQQVTPQQPQNQPGMQQPGEPTATHPDIDRPVPDASQQSDADRDRAQDKDRDRMQDKDRDRNDQAPAKGQITGERLATLDQFLDSHPQIAADLNKNPSLVNDENYVNSHKALKDFLNDHPNVRDALKDHPEQFIKKENRREQREDQQPH